MLTKRTLFGVIASLAVLAGALIALASQTELAPLPQAELAMTGQVTSAAEGAMEGVVVTAKAGGFHDRGQRDQRCAGPLSLPRGQTGGGAACTQHPRGGL